MNMTNEDDPDRRLAGWTARISRRQFIQGAVIATSTVTCASALAFDAASAPAATAAAGGLTPAEGRLLTAVLNHLIPAEGVMAAAGDLGVGAFIEHLLGDAPHLKPPIVGVLAKVNDRGQWCDLSDAERDRLLEDIQQHHTQMFDVLLQAAYTGYYGHSNIVAALEGRHRGEPSQHALSRSPGESATTGGI